jgi:HlyD family secretion protein
MRFLFKALIIVALSYACNTKSEYIYPTVEDVSESVYASGQVKARQQYQAFANANGIIADVFLSPGDSVKIGTPILSISNEQTRLNRENAELGRDYADKRANQARLLDMEVAIENARLKYINDSILFQRQRRLREQGIGSAVELEQRQLTFENAKAAHIAATLRYKELKREIDFNERKASNTLAVSQVLEKDLVLKSEVNGMVFGILKEKGEMVTAQTPLAVLGESRFYMELQVDEYDIAKVKEGQVVSISMDSYKGQVFQGVIEKINPIMDERSKTFLVEAGFTASPEVLYPNLSLEANIVIQNKKQVLTLPRNYIGNDRYVVTTSGDTLPVKLGLKDYIKAEILEGIDQNTAVIKP